MYGSMAAAAATGMIWRSTGTHALPFLAHSLMTDLGRVIGLYSWYQTNGDHLWIIDRRSCWVVMGQTPTPVKKRPSLSLRYFT